MAKPDMSRNKDLAGKTVSKGGYNISYNENGYATSTIKTGSKTGKAAAPSADTVGGGSDRGSYGGSVYDQEHFSNDELRSAAEVRAAAAAGKTTWADAHDYVERIRSNYGYSGDSDGSRYIPLEMGGGGRGNGGGGFSYEAAPTYTSRYQNQIDDLTRQILNREAFSYDPEKDPTYQQYKESYTRSGERAMQDTLGQVSARTGGLASSYAGSAAQQTYDNYMGALADKIPELKQLAYSMYQDEGNTQRANLEMLVALEQGDYAKYADLLAQYNTDRSFDYGVHRDNISDERYNNEWNYSVGRDQIADKRYEDETAYNRETYKDETEYNRALAKAQTLAAGGDFSGYKALGYTDQEIAGLKSAYNKAQASTRSGKSGGTGGKGGDVYSQMYNAGVRSYDDAYAWLRAAGYGTTDANRYANGLVNKIKSGDFEKSGDSGSGGKTSLDWDQDEGIFTWNGKQYNSVTSLAAAIDSAGLSDEEKRTVERKFKLFGFDISFS